MAFKALQNRSLINFPFGTPPPRTHPTPHIFRRPLSNNTSNFVTKVSRQMPWAVTTYSKLSLCFGSSLGLIFPWKKNINRNFRLCSVYAQSLAGTLWGGKGQSQMGGLPRVPRQTGGGLDVNTQIHTWEKSARLQKTNLQRKGKRINGEDRLQWSRARVFLNEG